MDLSNKPAFINKQEALERLTALEAEAKKLRTVIGSEPKKSKEERFWELILRTDSVKMCKETYPNSIFGFRGEDFLWEYDSENRHLWLSYRLIWSVLEDEYSLQHHDIQAYIKTEVEQRFKTQAVTPRRL